MRKATFLHKMIMVSILLALSSCSSNQELPVTTHPSTDAYEGWHLGCQAYSFNRFTFYEAVEKTASAGLDWIEAYPGQRLSSDKSDVRFDHTMPPEICEEVKQKLASDGVRLINYGVVGLPNDETECRKVFDFAKKMGIETIVAEPPEEAFDLVDRLCKEYRIHVAIHNHPKPSHYWNPDKVLEVCEGRSEWLGACGDTGHWMRSGINPLEALKKLQGRIVSLHFKDLNEFSVREAHDVVWGTGKADVKALLTELHRQHFLGSFSIEYEYNWDNSVPEIRQCVAYFNAVAGPLNPSGWKNLLADDLSNCTFKESSWTMDEGALTWHGGGYIWTKERYGDFILDMEYRVSEGANSGVFFRTGDLKDIVQTGMEVQIHETTDGSRYGACGAIYDCLAPSKNISKPAGEWNHYTITCKANKIYVVHNGEQIVDMDLNRWTEPHKNPDGTPNKFNTAYKDMPREGHIGFQDHGQPVWFRNLRIKQL
ncbi:MAG: family 16 glycoside hydrolase [bacterium]